MTIPLELAARIERLYTVEHWRVGTIARQLHVHRDTVRRVLRDCEVVPTGTPLRASLVDPYRSFIRETLEKYPTLTASRLHDMVCERGYTGQASHFRYLVSTMRPRPPAEAYLRLRTLPAEQMQCDWAHFGHLQIGRARRPLMGFVMVLSYSRRVFLRFCLNAQMDSFLRGHVEAFAAYGGLARTVLYDNLKSVVLERVGDAIRFNPEFLAFAKHYRFEPRPVAVARGNQKGRVFLTVVSPYRPLSCSGLYDIVSSRLKVLNVQCAHRGPHSLRHACATRLVAEGLSLKEIGDHLGHRSTSSTRVYAKVDLPGLREVAAFDLGELS